LSERSALIVALGGNDAPVSFFLNAESRMLPTPAIPDFSEITAVSEIRLGDDSVFYSATPVTPELL